jgi:hypothetical protein
MACNGIWDECSTFWDGLNARKLQTLRLKYNHNIEAKREQAGPT